MDLRFIKGSSLTFMIFVRMNDFTLFKDFFLWKISKNKNHEIKLLIKETKTLKLAPLDSDGIQRVKGEIFFFFPPPFLDPDLLIQFLMPRLRNLCY